MLDRRERNIKVFQDTEKLYQTNERLKDAVRKSIDEQKLILSDDVIVYENAGRKDGTVLVSGKRTLEAAEAYARKGKRVCILNFASATNPGGGVVHGSSAQEEALCRISTLYPCLNAKGMWNGFYRPHRLADNPLYNDDCIFTPCVKVFKTDTGLPELMSEALWWDVDVITCAAPNLREIPSNRMNPNAGSKKADITRNGLKKLHEKRIERIFQVAIAEHAEVLILGAFGCGAFCNPPEIVAEAFAKNTEKYRDCFEVIEYAVYHTAREKENFQVFDRVMKRFQ